MTAVYPRGNRVDWTWDGNHNMTERRRRTSNTSTNDASDIVDTWTYAEELARVCFERGIEANSPVLQCTACCKTGLTCGVGGRQVRCGCPFGQDEAFGRAARRFAVWRRRIWRFVRGRAANP